MIGISPQNITGANENTQFDVKPDICPCCKSRIDPVGPISSFINRENKSKSGLQIVYRCTHRGCQSLFISYYDVAVSCYFQRSVPMTFVQEGFSETVNKISLQFCKIYNEPLAAEGAGL